MERRRRLVARGDSRRGGSRDFFAASGQRRDGALIATGDGAGGQALRNTSGITVKGDTSVFYDLSTAHYLPTGEIVPMPEPGATSLLALAAACALARRRR